MPAAHDGGDGRRIGEAQALQRFERVGIVLDAGEDEIAGGRGKGGRFLEQVRIVALDQSEDARQRGGELRGVGEAEEERDAPQALGVGRQAVRLLVVHHLQAMLDAAQKSVALFELRGGLRGDAAGAGERLRARRTSRARAARARARPR